ncbi:SIMPL domain-containing protein [Nocardia sp. CDC153]|uniref:SIMPL domain-containing protein n=1 Tax=Nocardia sp. CDC153 TaxID=3112167 RepID=UPI002DB6F4AC|nr:SIMPL domain-containing protein [Nocardia sp. CDC153]MEC3958673.1 SIMPL domain-containing protein [Nocardia sp. CDC153]
MRRLSAICAATVGVALLLTGCGGSDSGDRTVTVTGTGKVQGTPDVLNADLGTEVSAGDVSAAVDQANAKAKAITDAMVTAGAKREDIKTSDLSVQPTYGTDGHNITGYRATNSMHVAVRELPKASGILSAAVQAGGNDTRINSVTFGLEDNTKLLSDARARAFDDAKSRAQQYADLSGLKLKTVKTISENGSGATPTPTPMYRDAVPGAAPNINLEPGQQTVTFEVTVAWNMG